MVESKPLLISVSATGTLLARESVQIVAELSRRLVRIRAKEGERVQKGAVLFELDSKDLHAEIAALRVEENLARSEAQRARALLQEGLTTQAEKEVAESRVESLEARRKLLGVTLDKTVVRAPFAGTLGLRRVSEGAWLSPNTVLTTLEDTSELKVDFTLPERYLPLLAVGTPFQVSVTGASDSVTGKVAAIESSVSAASRSIVLRGSLESSQGLKPGSFARVELPLSFAEALQVPNLSVIPDVEGRKVFIVDAEGIARSVRVETGERGPELVQILSGLEPGARVIRSNLLRVRDGARVQVLNGATP